MGFLFSIPRVIADSRKLQLQAQEKQTLPTLPATSFILSSFLRILVGLIAEWTCPATVTLSEAVKFAEVLAHLVSTDTPSWFAAMRSGGECNSK